MYAAGCVFRTFSIAWRQYKRKSSASVRTKSALKALRDPSKVPRAFPIGQLSASALLHRDPFLVVFIINIAESDFRYTQ
jgi:hypothetical protein